uniref:Uncharacterized protein n=1 Tax=Anguilla anguilla TaxID=7936 RepID=A0A0E9TIK7_ANGAN
MSCDLSLLVYLSCCALWESPL